MPLPMHKDFFSFFFIFFDFSTKTHSGQTPAAKRFKFWQEIDIKIEAGVAESDKPYEPPFLFLRGWQPDEPYELPFSF